MRLPSLNQNNNQYVSQRGAFAKQVKSMGLHWEIVRVR